MNCPFPDSSLLSCCLLPLPHPPGHFINPSCFHHLNIPNFLLHLFYLDLQYIFCLLILMFKEDVRPFLLCLFSCEGNFFSKNMNLTFFMDLAKIQFHLLHTFAVIINNIFQGISAFVRNPYSKRNLEL